MFDSPPAQQGRGGNTTVTTQLCETSATAWTIAVAAYGKRAGQVMRKTHDRCPILPSDRCPRNQRRDAICSAMPFLKGPIRNPRPTRRIVLRPGNVAYCLLSPSARCNGGGVPSHPSDQVQADLTHQTVPRPAQHAPAGASDGTNPMRTETNCRDVRTTGTHSRASFRRRPRSDHVP